MTIEHDFYGPNYGYILELYDRFLANPASVDEATRSLFANWKPESPPEPEPSIPHGQSSSNLLVVLGAAGLAQAIRSRGYLAAALDPLGTPPIGDPSLTLAFHNLQADDLRQLPAQAIGLPEENAYLGIERLRSIYCWTIGYDYGHVHVPAERDWLYQAAEGGRFRKPLDETKLLDRLTQIEAFELFLHRLYPGKTRFSIEGLDMMIPMLDEAVNLAELENIGTIMIGMAHRGRLNVLAHVMQKSYREILAEYKDPQGRAATWGELGWTGDVKYHMGAYKLPDEGEKTELILQMPPNPSHLEMINPFLLGMARAADEAVNQMGAPRFFGNAALPLLIHGDASFVGQGIVPETLNLSRLYGYSTNGSLHIIANNQVGFTAIDRESRSSQHASDLAKGFEMPVIHANADDPMACIEAIRTAFAYRQEFKKDFVINLIGYRRYGHNEGDEPRFTQPVMYQAVDKHPSLRQLWAAKLGVEDQAELMLQKRLKEMQQISEQLLDAEKALDEPVPHTPPHGAAKKVDTTLPFAQLQELNQALLKFPADFHLNPKLVKTIEKQSKLLDDPSSKIDWSVAEQLAFASILQDGIAIRLTGEDSARGTFSQRHAVFHDFENGERHIPLQTLPQAQASFEIINSPLSEEAVIGFEVGYNVQAPDRLVLWEAQYGDFVNGAQAVLDEFLFSGRAKWGLTPSLVMLLPHGNEGMGPDHSSARIERFLGLAAETNARIVYPSTAAQYFHLLRRQSLLLKTDPLPLVIFTPKGLLRHPLTASPASEFVEGRWQPVINDTDLSAKPEDVVNVLLCSGRIYADLATSPLRAANPDDAIVRLEQLYPFPKEAIEKVLSYYPNCQRVIWVQEDPLNMGAWPFLNSRLRKLVEMRGLTLHYVGRPESSSPSEGSSTLYRINQQMLVDQAFAFEKQVVTNSVIKERG